MVYHKIGSFYSGAVKIFVSSALGRFSGHLKDLYVVVSIAYAFFMFVESAWYDRVMMCLKENMLRPVKTRLE